ncbi:DNA topoisomerase III [Heliorestis acidaminivorans]|uniref:DNA topoisomerase 3 n=1 Tax=Heliorestis acidaminivorans TaxID=553427 RepID=A0A6I0F2Q0_9FIRM|nr:DNA topoisomerase III [Heliorestis acidaminivorans]KAB2953840.1 DNA topoisomerase III [Heliorestis acidaminivorans]
MSKTLVLAEKPSVGKDLARLLQCNGKRKGYFESDRYIVTWALGHLVTLADPESYDEKYKSWRIEDLPLLPQQLKLVVIKESSGQFRTVKELLQRQDVKEIILATDAGREGELVGRWILEKANVKKPLKRLWISSVTDKAIREGFQKLKNGKEYENLYASAVARSEADWLVGINATRALTCKFNAQLSCGRVQTPTLAIIAKREEEIKNFQPQTYYTILATAQVTERTSNLQPLQQGQNHNTQNLQLKLHWQDQKTKDLKSFDKNRSDQILRKLQGQTGKVIEVSKKAKKSYAPALYDLTELQRDANKLFAYSAKETLSILQKLYEQHKILTYPRTDSRYISSDMVDTLKERIKASSHGPYAAKAAQILRKPLQVSKAFVDDSKVSDHHAIIPTEETVFLNKLTDKERKIYDLVVKRFLAVFYRPFEYEQITMTAQIGDERFIARGKRILQRGWKEVYDHFNDQEDDEEERDKEANLTDQNLPELQAQQSLTISHLNQKTGETRPPAYFNEGTLLTAMENPVPYMKGEKADLVKTLGETGGLGTVATRADIIEKLFNSFLLEKKGKDIHITSKGRQLLELVPSDLQSPALTAQWEQKLSAIAKGTLPKGVFVNEMKKYAQAVVEEIKKSEKSFKHDNLTGEKCPQCGKKMLQVNSKKGQLLVCQDRECGQRKNIAKTTNARCPECKKKLELRGQGESQIFYCKCGYREKLAVFQERRKKDPSKVSKQDVSKYLQKQKKEAQEPINNALAEALAKLKGSL